MISCRSWDTSSYVQSLYRLIRYSPVPTRAVGCCLKSTPHGSVPRPGRVRFGWLPSAAGDQGEKCDLGMSEHFPVVVNSYFDFEFISRNVVQGYKKKRIDIRDSDTGFPRKSSAAQRISWGPQQWFSIMKTGLCPKGTGRGQMPPPPRRCCRSNSSRV